MGAEVSYRQNMPLVSDPVNVLPASFVPLSPGSIATTAVPSSGTPGALGDTWHGVLNGVNIFPKTALFDIATLAGELTWMQWTKVTQNEAVFKGRSNYTAIDKASKNFVGLAFNFTPTWFQVFPGVDLLAPMTWSQGISGNSAVAFGGSENGGNWSAGIARRHLPEVPDRPQVQRLLRQLLDQPDGADARRRRDGRAQRRELIAVRPRLGVAHVQDHLLTRSTDMFRKSLMALAIASLAAGSALAAVSADEAKQLGTSLTAVGAEKAGNKDGTIPEYTGGIKPPAGFQAGTTVRPDPFANEKPRLTITGKDMAAHADKLTEGTKELLKRYPTMRVDVYPTHRTVAVPQRILDNTAKNATGAKTLDGGVALENVMPGYPFPIPKTGSEAIWNHLLRYNGIGYDNPRYENWNVDSAGVPTLAVAADANWAWPIFDPKKSGPISASDPYWLVKLNYVGPARRNGEALLWIDAVNPLKQPRRAWQYLPGQRRVRLAPDLAYDTPNPGAAGAGTYDDVSVFNGAIDRFDWKLIGKKEMYVPYSSYRLTYHKTAADITKPNHLNPDLVRWELHRVWVVEATLKPDKRHIYSKRDVLPRRGQLDGARLRPVRRARAALSLELRVSSRSATTCRRRFPTRSRSTTSARACTTSPACSARTTVSST